MESEVVIVRTNAAARHMPGNGQLMHRSEELAAELPFETGQAHKQGTARSIAHEVAKRKIFVLPQPQQPDG
jgi:hypothetical protein